MSEPTKCEFLKIYKYIRKTNIFQSCIKLINSVYLQIEKKSHYTKPFYFKVQMASSRFEKSSRSVWIQGKGHFIMKVY